MRPEEIWRAKSNEEVSDAMAAIDEYTDVGQRIIRDEVARRGITSAEILQRSAGSRADRIGRAVRWQSIMARCSIIALALNVLMHLPVLTGSTTFAEDLLAFNGGLAVATGIVFVTWLFRAYSNLTLVGTGQVTYSTAWAIGCWFIPFLSFLRPYQIVDDLWITTACSRQRRCVSWAPLRLTPHVRRLNLRTSYGQSTFLHAWHLDTNGRDFGRIAPRGDASRGRAPRAEIRAASFA